MQAVDYRCLNHCYLKVPAYIKEYIVDRLPIKSFTIAR